MERFEEKTFHYYNTQYTHIHFYAWIYIIHDLLLDDMRNGFDDP
jgi:hypothetical protein